jgi:flagellin
MYANRLLKYREIDLNKDIEKLSSGEKINRAGDDASGLAVSEKLRSQIRGLHQA